MNIRKTILAAAIALAAGQAVAASTMASPVAFSAQEKARLIATLNGERGKHGLDTDHGFVIAAQHPGANGQAISRLNHTYKGVRIFESESVVVTDAGGNIVSESIGERRKGQFAKNWEELRVIYEELKTTEATYTKELHHFAQTQAPRLDQMRERLKSVGRRIGTTIAAPDSGETKQ